MIPGFSAPSLPPDVIAAKMAMLERLSGRADATLWAVGALELDWLCADQWQAADGAKSRFAILERTSLGITGMASFGVAELFRVRWVGELKKGDPVTFWQTAMYVDLLRWRPGDLCGLARFSWFRLLTAAGKAAPEIRELDSPRLYELAQILSTEHARGRLVEAR